MNNLFIYLDINRKSCDVNRIISSILPFGSLFIDTISLEFFHSSYLTGIILAYSRLLIKLYHALF